MKIAKGADHLEERLKATNKGTRVYSIGRKEKTFGNSVPSATIESGSPDVPYEHLRLSHNECLMII